MTLYLLVLRSHTKLRNCQVVPIDPSFLQILHHKRSCEAYAGMPAIDIHLGYGTCLVVSIFDIWGIISFGLADVCIRLRVDLLGLALLPCNQNYGTCNFYFVSFGMFACACSNYLPSSIDDKKDNHGSFLILLLYYNFLPFYFKLIKIRLLNFFLLCLCAKIIYQIFEIL